MLPDTISLVPEILTASNVPVLSVNVKFALSTNALPAPINGTRVLVKSLDLIVLAARSNVTLALFTLNVPVPESNVNWLESTNALLALANGIRVPVRS